jgi:cephalosporin hydroxylase
MSEVAKFFAEVANNIERQGKDKDVQALSRIWLREITPYRYAYNFTWMGRPVIQFPQDMIALQELIWQCKPDAVIEVGVAHGGMLIYYASLLELLGGHRLVVGVDIEIRHHNRIEIERHPMSSRIRLIESSSVIPETAALVRNVIGNTRNILVILDSNHTHEHVLAELRLYSSLVGKNNYIVVMDTLIDDMPESFFRDRPWGPGNNPKTAIASFFEENQRFAVDSNIDAKLLISAAPGGYLKCIED